MDGIRTRAGQPEKTARVAGSSSGYPLLTVTMENGAVEEAPRAVWLGRVAAVMEARGDRDEAVRLYGEAAAALTGEGRNVRDGGRKVGIDLAARANGSGVSSPVDGGGIVAGVSETTNGGSGGGGTGNLFPYSARAHYLASIIERSYRRHFNRCAASCLRRCLSTYPGPQEAAPYPQP